MARPADPNAKSALVAAARAQFREHGIQRARIEDITGACGLSKGAFYLHYESKEALFTELVRDFERRMDEMFARRTAEEEAFFAKRGAFRRNDFATGSERLAALNELQMRQDIETLELMWGLRDVIHVLMNGCQGTGFEGVMWHVIDRERHRVVEACDRLKRFGVIRTDVSSDAIAKALMGTWMLTLRDMLALPEKPDFAATLGELNLLLGAGLAPAAPAPVASSRTRRRRGAPRNARMRKAK